MGVFRFKFTGPVFVPDKAGELGDRGLGIEAVYISNLSDDSGRVNLAYAGDGRQRVWDNLELLFKGLVQYLDRFSKARIDAIDTAMAWFTVSFTVLGRR